jgi:hypothetical protein
MSSGSTMQQLARERAESQLDKAALWPAYRAAMPAAVALFAQAFLAAAAKMEALRDRCRALDERIAVARAPSAEAQELRRQRACVLSDPQSAEVLAGGLQARCDDLDAKIAALARPTLEAEELQRQRDKLHLEAAEIETRFPLDVMTLAEAEVLARGRPGPGAFERLLGFLFGRPHADVDADALAELLERLNIKAATHRAHVAAWIAAGRAKVKMETAAALEADIERLTSERRAAAVRAAEAGRQVYELGQSLEAVTRDFVNASVASIELAHVRHDFPEIFPAEDGGVTK